MLSVLTKRTETTSLGGGGGGGGGGEGGGGDWTVSDANSEEVKCALESDDLGDEISFGLSPLFWVTTEIWLFFSVIQAILPAILPA